MSKWKRNHPGPTGEMLTAGQTVRRPCTALAHNAQSRAELTQVILYVESNPTMVKSIANFAKSL